MQIVAEKMFADVVDMVCLVPYSCVMSNTNEREIMNTTTEIQYLVTLPNAELAHMFNRAASKGNADWANDIWNALYARVYRQQYPNDIWTVGDSRESRLIDAVNYQIDNWR